MTELMHFKFTHNGSWHRFVLPTRGCRKAFRRLKKRILSVLGATDQQIWWDDGETINRLDDSVDLAAAIAFAEQEGQLLSTIPCVYIQFDATPSAQTEEMETLNALQQVADDSIRERIEHITTLSEEMRNSTIALQQAIEFANVEEQTGLRTVSEKISQVNVTFTEQERMLEDIRRSTEEVQRQLNERCNEEQAQNKADLLLDDLSLEEQRLAHLGYLPCATRGQADPDEPPFSLTSQATLDDWQSKQRFKNILSEALRRTLPNADALIRKANAQQATAPSGGELAQSAAASSSYAAVFDDWLSQMLTATGAVEAVSFPAEAPIEDDVAKRDAESEAVSDQTRCRSRNFVALLASLSKAGAVADEDDRDLDFDEVKSKKQKRREEKKHQWKAEKRAMGGAVDSEVEEEEKPFHAPLDATHTADCSSPVPPVRSPQYDGLVGIFERSEEESMGAEEADEQQSRIADKINTMSIEELMARLTMNKDVEETSAPSQSDAPQPAVDDELQFAAAVADKDGCASALFASTTDERRAELEKKKAMLAKMRETKKQVGENTDTMSRYAEELERRKKWEKRELTIQKMGERMERKRVLGAREELDKLSMPTAVEERTFEHVRKEEMERQMQMLHSLQESERTKRELKEENMEEKRADDEKRESTCAESKLFELERKNEKEMLMKMLHRFKQSEITNRKLDKDVGMDEEEENVRMVEKYIQREAESARRLQERELEKLKKAFDENDKQLNHAAQASILNNEAQLAPEEEKRKNQLKMIRTIINNITTETADELTKEFLMLKVHGWTYLNDVVSIIFDKAVDEPHYCHLLANLCYQAVQEELRTNTNNVSYFRNSLLVFSQDTFTTMEMDGVFKAQIALLDAATDEYSENQLQTDLAETKNKWRKRKLGNILFIGHMYRQKIISIKIISFCVIDLLKSVTARQINSSEDNEIDEASIECAVRLLETAGARLQEEMDDYDDQLRPPPVPPRGSLFPMDRVFATLEEALPLLTSSPVSAMITNLIELRKNGWVPKTSVPVTAATEAIGEKKENLQKRLREIGMLPTPPALTVCRFPQQDILPAYRPSSPSAHWDCSTCCVSNRNADEKCVCCEEAKPASSDVPSSGSQAKDVQASSASVPRADDVLSTNRNWNCVFCCVANKAADVTCTCCGEANLVKKKTASSDRPLFPISFLCRGITSRLGQCVMNYATSIEKSIELDKTRDEIFKIINTTCQKFVAPSTVIGFKCFMAAAVDKSTTEIGGLEVAYTFGEVLAACLKVTGTGSDDEILKGINEFCHEVVAKDAWNDTPKVWDIVAEVLVSAHLHGVRPSIANLQDVFQTAANDTHSDCTLFVSFLENLAGKEQSRDNYADTLNDIISLIFAESVERPELNRFLASMCTAQINKERIKDVDTFRNAILVRAQTTFSTSPHDLMMQMQEDRVSYRISRYMSPRDFTRNQDTFRKNKFGNIMFIGQLYLHGIVSSRLVMHAISDLLGPVGRSADYSETFGQRDSDSVECVVHLITLCGENLHEEAKLPPPTENASRVVSENSLDALFATLDTVARVVSERVKRQIDQLMVLRAYNWRKKERDGEDDGWHKKQSAQTSAETQSGEEHELIPVMFHQVIADEEIAAFLEKYARRQEDGTVLPNKQAQSVIDLMKGVDWQTREKRIEEFLAMKLHESLTLDEIVSVIFDVAAQQQNKHSLYASLCTAQIAAELRDSGDSKFLQAVYDHICDGLRAYSEEDVRKLEMALLKETDTYKRMLKQSEINEARRRAKMRKHANIKFVAEIYLQNADIELARLLQTCLVKLLHSALAARNLGELYEMDWESYGCAVDVLEMAGRQLEESMHTRTDMIPTLNCIFDAVKSTAPQYGSFAALGEKVVRLISIRDNGWNIPLSKSEILVNKAIALLDSVAADQLVDEVKNTHEITDDEQLKRLVSHIFEKAAEHPGDGLFYANFCATQIAQERSASGEEFSRFGRAILANSYEILDKSHYNKIVAEKEIEMAQQPDEEIRMTMMIDLIDLKCKLREKAISQILFIGHLFLVDVVHAAILQYAVTNLLKTIAKNPMGDGQPPDEESIECALQLLQLCGSRLHDEIIRAALSGYSTPFNMHETMNDLERAKPRLSGTLRLMIEQLQERRLNGWTSTSTGGLTTERKHDNPWNEPWDLDYDYSEPDLEGASEEDDEEEEEEDEDDNEFTSDDEEIEKSKEYQKKKNAYGSSTAVATVEDLPLPEGRWWESLQAQLESTGLKPKEPASVSVAKEVTPGFRMPYSPKKSEKGEAQNNSRDAPQLVESVEVKPGEKKTEEELRSIARQPYSPTQTGMQESYPIPASIPSSISGNSEEVTPLSVQAAQGLARQPYSDDEGDTTSSSTSSTSTSSSSTSSWSKVESVDSGSEYSNIDPASDSEM